MGSVIATQISNQHHQDMAQLQQMQQQETQRVLQQIRDEQRCYQLALDRHRFYWVASTVGASLAGM
jgi:23S rRNA pseudoU1915 N3-methylase RlmH